MKYNQLSPTTHKRRVRITESDLRNLVKRIIDSDVYGDEDAIHCAKKADTLDESIRRNKSQLNRIINKSVKRVLNEVSFNGKELHGQNPSDWIELMRARQEQAQNATDSEQKEKYWDKALRDEDSAWDAKAIRTQKLRDIDVLGKKYRDEFVDLNPREYRCSDLYDSQADKVFNNGRGLLAFVRFLADERVILVNKPLVGRRDLDLIKNNFPDWEIEFVELGYPDWYTIKNLLSVRR